LAGERVDEHLDELAHHSSAARISTRRGTI
jgi:hypothetical protein